MKNIIERIKAILDEAAEIKACCLTEKQAIEVETANIVKISATMALKKQSLEKREEAVSYIEDIAKYRAATEFLEKKVNSERIELDVKTNQFEKHLKEQSQIIVDRSNEVANQETHFIRERKALKEARIELIEEKKDFKKILDSLG